MLWLFLDQLNRIPSSIIDAAVATAFIIYGIVGRYEESISPRRVDVSISCRTPGVGNAQCDICIDMDAFIQLMTDVSAQVIAFIAGVDDGTFLCRSSQQMLSCLLSQ